MGNAIARWTTPSIMYKPSAVEMNTIIEIYLVIKQNGETIIEKAKEDAIESEDGYRWALTQEETALLLRTQSAVIQVDYKCADGMRYTTKPKEFEVKNSAKNEAI